MDWFDAAGISLPSRPRGPHFADANALLRAAADGVGVALGRSTLAQEDLGTGQLIEPFATRIRASYGCWFVTPTRRRHDERVARVQYWLAEQFAATLTFKACSRYPVSD
ncbi:MAG: LysR substrate-binding domain-containing protein [Gammaproteobacteria bacterium]|nr:LysR substrate-binding domain-containing protein [Gammaproteobacteria bacterium]